MGDAHSGSQDIMTTPTSHILSLATEHEHSREVARISQLNNQWHNWTTHDMSYDLDHIHISARECKLTCMVTWHWSPSLLGIGQPIQQKVWEGDAHLQSQDTNTSPNSHRNAKKMHFFSQQTMSTQETWQTSHNSTTNDKTRQSMTWHITQTSYTSPQGMANWHAWSIGTHPHHC